MELIDKKELIETLKKSPVWTGLDAIARINAMATISVESPEELAHTRVGIWKWKLADNGWKDIYCSVCGHTENVDIHVCLGWKYCPHCGARME